MMWTKQAKRKLKKISFFTLLLFVFQTAPPVQLWLPETSAELYMHIGGKITDAQTGEFIPNVDVIVVRKDDPKAANNGAKTKADGRYVICCVPPGTYQVFIDPQNKTQYIKEQPPKEITVIRGRNLINADFQLQKGSAATGRAYNADGTTPANQVVVLAIQQSETERHTSYAATPTNGQYTLQGLRPEKTYIVYANAPNQASVYKTVQTSSTGQANAELNFTLGNPATKLSGKVESNGVPVKDAIVRVRNDKAAGSAITDAQGHYVISGLLAGNYAIMVEKEGYQFFLDAPVAVQESMEAVKDVSIVASATTSGKAMPKTPKSKLPVMGFNFPSRVSQAHAATPAYGQLVITAVSFTILLAAAFLTADLLFMALNNAGFKATFSAVISDAADFCGQVFARFTAQSQEGEEKKIPSIIKTHCTPDTEPGREPYRDPVTGLWWCSFTCVMSVDNVVIRVFSELRQFSDGNKCNESFDY